MDSLTEDEITQIAKLQTEEGVQRLSSHFPWLEFSDERQRLHQDFVYNAAMFAVERGFSWPNVIQVAGVAKGLFPQLDGLDVTKLMSVLRAALSESLPNLTSVQQYEFVRYLTETVVIRQRLLQAAVRGEADMLTEQIHLEVELPPTPCPLSEGMELEEWEVHHQTHQLTLTLQQKEQELKNLRESSRVTLGDVDVPEDARLDKEGVLQLVRTALSAARGQMEASLDQEVSLVGEIMQLKLQQATSATRSAT
ncbi:uncharacterized protein C8orf74 homolog [Genypterus blacodes]|uniref:uncharacterized protein C8orf74 homolog n=1 Tax=Genypterus blacodes TaxID=154954 RepID=UPI003F757FAD